MDRIRIIEIVVGSVCILFATFDSPYWAFLRSGRQEGLTFGKESHMVIYFAETTVAEQRELLCRWVERFYAGRKPIQVLVDSTYEAQSIDKLLWTFSQGSFIPHSVLNPGGAPPDDPVLITPGEFQVEGFEVLVCDLPASLEFMMKFETAVHFIMRDNEQQRRESRNLWQKARESGADTVHVPYRNQP
jgi:DNA polymerase-3 subunit chi